MILLHIAVKKQHGNFEALGEPLDSALGGSESIVFPLHPKRRGDIDEFSVSLFHHQHCLVIFSECVAPNAKPTPLFLWIYDNLRLELRTQELSSMSLFHNARQQVTQVWRNEIWNIQTTCLSQAKTVSGSILLFLVLLGTEIKELGWHWSAGLSKRQAVHATCGRSKGEWRGRRGRWRTNARHLFKNCKAIAVLEVCIHFFGTC